MRTTEIAVFRVMSGKAIRKSVEGLTVSVHWRIGKIE